MASPSRSQAGGFSLVEVLIATGITIGIGAIVFQLFQQNERLFQDEAVRVEMQQTARMLIAQIGDDIRIAGQSVPPSLTDIVLPGSSAHRLNLRSAFSAAESIVTTAPPILATLGSPVTLAVENTSGFSTGRQIFVWNVGSWIRATVNSISGSAQSVRMTPSAGSGNSAQFDTSPIIGLDEAIALYFDPSTNAVRRTTSTNTTSATNPVWAPANEIATNVVSLDFLYFDRNGGALIPDTPQKRANITTIEARVQVRPATPVSGSMQPVYRLSVTARPRNLGYK